VRRVFLLVVLVLLLPYLRTAVYDFPDPAPFSGPAFFNPYHGLTGTWQRANLHAHGRPWAGFTSGRHTSDQIVEAYRRAGYSIAGLVEVSLIGLLFSWLLWRTGSLRVPIFCHALYNTLIVVVLVVMDSIQQSSINVIGRSCANR